MLLRTGGVWIDRGVRRELIRKVKQAKQGPGRPPDYRLAAQILDAYISNANHAYANVHHPMFGDWQTNRLEIAAECLLPLASRQEREGAKAKITRSLNLLCDKGLLEVEPVRITSHPD